MDKTGHAQVDARRTQDAHPPLVFISQSAPAFSTPQSLEAVPPFTEIPEELLELREPEQEPKQEPEKEIEPVNENPRRLINALFLLLLGLSLLVLIAVFTYQLIFHPDVLAGAGIRLVSGVEGFFRALIGVE